MVLPAVGPAIASAGAAGAAGSAGLAAAAPALGPLAFLGFGLDVVGGLTAGPSRGDIRQAEAAQRQLREAEAVTNLQRILIGGQPVGPSPGSFAPVPKGPSTGAKIQSAGQDILALAQFQQAQASAAAKTQAQTAQFQEQQRQQNLRQLTEIEADKQAAEARAAAELQLLEVKASEDRSKVLFESLENSVIEEQKQKGRLEVEQARTDRAGLSSASRSVQQRSVDNTLKRINNKTLLGVPLTPQDEFDLNEANKVSREIGGLAPFPGASGAAPAAGTPGTSSPSQFNQAQEEFKQFLRPTPFL